MKYTVTLEFWKCLDIEADSEEEAIEKAKIKATNNPDDYFTEEDEIANFISEMFNENHSAEEVGEDK